MHQFRQQREDAIGKAFDKWVRAGRAGGMERRHKRLARLMLQRFELPPDARVLDIGCGDGWTARMLSGLLPVGAFVGIDLSGEMIRSARDACKRLDNVLFAPASAEQIPWVGDYFTHVLSIESAYYWPDPGMAAREIYRVTNYGGTFHILINYYAENTYSHGWERETGLPLHLLSSEQWTGLFRDCGFEDVSSERIPDDSPISTDKTPAERANREGLQRVGALYIQGRKSDLSESTARTPEPARNPLPVLR